MGDMQGDDNSPAGHMIAERRSLSLAVAPADSIEVDLLHLTYKRKKNSLQCHFTVIH